MEGIYYCVIRKALAEILKNDKCLKVGMTSSSTLSLQFRKGWLHLNAKPDSPGLWWTGNASIISPDSPSWEHHIAGAPVEKVMQQGVDRVIEIHFSSRTPYDAGGIRLIFEAAGRNSNIILVRKHDNRILASLRKVLSAINRYRAISPGVVYKSPPKSGIPPEKWNSDEMVELLKQKITPRLLYQNLEGVGPASAKSIIAESDDVFETVKWVGKQLLEENFSPWKTQFGNLPVKLGEGIPIKNPLSPPEEKIQDEKRDEYRPSRTQLSSILKKRLSSENKKVKSSEKSLGKLASPEELRSWGNLILTHKNDLRKGMKKTIVTDWDGTPIEIKLKEALNPAENANKYFRKASKVHLEQNNLEERILTSMERINYLEEIQNRVKTMSDQEVTKYIAELGKPEKKETGAPLEYILTGGWRCLVGRNAKQNDQLTFKIGARNDIWLHARGVPGAHVIVKRDGRADNPSAQSMDHAAFIAAKHCSSNGIIPIDWTLVKYVRRIKGGGPGQVTYTREKTIFAEA